MEDVCSFIKETGVYQSGDSLHTIFKKIWDICPTIHKKVNKLRTLPKGLKEHICPSLTFPLEAESLPALVMYHVKTTDSYLLCEEASNMVSISEEQLILKEEPKDWEDLPSLEKMDFNDEVGDDTILPPYEDIKEDIPIKKEQEIKQETTQVKTSPTDDWANQSASSLDLHIKKEIKTEAAEPTHPRSILKQSSDSKERSIYVEVSQITKKALEAKQRALDNFPGLTYKHGGRHLLTHLLSAGHTFSDLPETFRKKYLVGQTVSLRDAIRFDHVRHWPLIDCEKKELLKEDTSFRAVPYQCHQDEVAGDAWMDCQPLCCNCLLHHTPKGGCSSITAGLPALAATHNRSLKSSLLENYRAIYVSLDEQLQVLSPDMRISVLNLSPSVKHPVSIQHLEYTPSDYVQLDSENYSYEFEFTTRILILLNKIGKTDLPIILMPRFRGTSAEQATQARVVATALAKLQALYDGMLIAICPFATYQEGMDTTEYLEEKKISRVTGDFLTAHLIARGMASITIEVAATPVDDIPNVFCVHEDWRLSEPLYTFSGNKRREFYRRFGDALEKKIHLILKYQITKTHINNMKKKLSPIEAYCIYESDTSDDLDDICC